MDVPEPHGLIRIGRGLMEVGELEHERRFVEQVEHLTTVKLDSVDQIDGIVTRGQQRLVGYGMIPLAIPTQIIHCPVEPCALRGRRLTGELIIGHTENSAGKGPIRGRAEIIWEASAIGEYKMRPCKGATHKVGQCCLQGTVAHGSRMDSSVVQRVSHGQSPKWTDDRWKAQEAQGRGHLSLGCLAWAILEGRLDDISIDVDIWNGTYRTLDQHPRDGSASHRLLEAVARCWVP